MWRAPPGENQLHWMALSDILQENHGKPWHVIGKSMVSGDGENCLVISGAVVFPIYIHSTNLLVLHGFMRFVKVDLLQNLLLKPELLEARLLPRCLPVSDPFPGQGYLADTCDITCHSAKLAWQSVPEAYINGLVEGKICKEITVFTCFFTSNYRALPYIFPHNAVNRSQDVACWFNPCRTLFSTSHLDVRLV